MHPAGRAILGFILGFTLLLSGGCGKAKPELPDHPRVPPNVVMRDEVFHSAALSRDMRYRVFLPAFIRPEQKLNAVYLLHGADGTFRDWSNYSDVAQYAAEGLALIMPQGDYSYYVNAALRPADRYEDYIVNDLLSDVAAKYPVQSTPRSRAIVGVSMGGFGAIKIGLSHPEHFAFAGALSPAIDAARRDFSLRRIQQSWEFRSLFGPTGGAERRSRDPFWIARNADAAIAPFVFLSCGDKESLLPPNREFADVLAKQGLHHEFHVGQGGHDWNQWNAQLPDLFAKMGRQPSVPEP